MVFGFVVPFPGFSPRPVISELSRSRLHSRVERDGAVTVHWFLYPVPEYKLASEEALVRPAQQGARVELVLPADLRLQTSLLKMGPKERYAYISDFHPWVHPAVCPRMLCLVKMNFQE
jgi:hypothetical protein